MRVWAPLSHHVLSAVLYCEMDVEEIFANAIPLTEIAQRLGVGRDLFYGWVKSNGFAVTRIKGNRIAVTKEIGEAIFLEAKRQGLENPSVHEIESVPDIPIAEKGTLAYRLEHPSFSSETPRWTKAPASGYTGDQQPL
jgi:hypothetical protein